ncbi:MAG: site-2 protease family protein [Candidatus Eremiobacteraeota bacterium]|nr:site-2 protease family protein [Candidatus Eremiobacteraeota bacterium]
MNQHDPIEGEYVAPDPAIQKQKPKARGIGAIAATLLLVGAKLKAIVFFLLQFKFAIFGLKLLTASWTFLLSLWLYVLLFGWRLGVVILLAIAAHELGHYFAYRAYGLQARLPVFVPLLGAYTQGAIAPDLEQDAYIALAGPLTGLALAGACQAAGLLTGDSFWYACAGISAFLNLFNMIPVPPFDGGRVIGAVWPGMWLVGIVLFVVAAVFLHVPVFMVLLIALLGIPTMLAAFRGKVDPRAANMTNGARLRVSLWYLATMAALIVVLGQAHAAAPSNAPGL